MAGSLKDKKDCHCDISSPGIAVGAFFARRSLLFDLHLHAAWLRRSVVMWRAYKSHVNSVSFFADA